MTIDELIRGESKIVELLPKLGSKCKLWDNDYVGWIIVQQAVGQLQEEPELMSKMAGR